MRSLVLTILILACTPAARVCQAQLPSISFENKINGKVQVVTYSREFWIVNGRPVQPRSEVNTITEYANDGKTTRHSEYGNIERRRIYTYSNGKESIQIQYLTLDGERISTDKASFEARADVIFENDLCPNFSTKTELDKKAAIERVIETCDTNTLRATTVIEENSDSTYLRKFREDAKGRSYESVLVFGRPSYPKEFRYIVNNMKAPKYSWNIACVNPKFDPNDNLTEIICTAAHSSKPNVAAYQYVERFEYTYF